MLPQNQITEPCELLDNEGLLTSAGYAVKQLWRYDRRKIKAGWHRMGKKSAGFLLQPENQLHAGQGHDNRRRPGIRFRG